MSRSFNVTKKYLLFLKRYVIHPKTKKPLKQKGFIIRDTGEILTNQSKDPYNNELPRSRTPRYFIIAHSPPPLRGTPSLAMRKRGKMCHFQYPAPILLPLFRDEREAWRVIQSRAVVIFLPRSRTPRNSFD